ncbi:hypothetical protein SDRG_15506 [Saprolegnia diclina VS20]|uniref:Uncharacterized protein n=1 Tax=Saprolegnia diclina (strain VS20) TaxID=1156394 RepID=T0R3P1_SAPDV|nr:hypothetical protein SDRG_15506 [Saprolegnia diclina VS20]EQC26668.1 hypothetical protein SDRG_15506 [Saprolegnia diclina VS20]|eukprot:XP_008619903.1 hypothetical protein SDRG_15506 [Saprolegnia diclina VS20]
MGMRDFTVSNSSPNETLERFQSHEATYLFGLGLRLSYLRHVINEHGGEAAFAGKTTAQVANDPTTAAYVAPANCASSPTGLADDAVLWFCVFNNNQHLASSYPFEYWSSTFKNGLAAIGNVVMIMHPWNDPIVLRRSWCVFAFYVAVTLGARFEIALARDQEATFLNDIADFDAFNKMLATIKSEDSEATVASDRDVDRLILLTLTRWIEPTLELGLLFDALHQHKERERCFQDALRLRLKTHGPMDADTLLLLSLVAFAMVQANKPRRSWETLFQSTLGASLTHLGETHPTTLATRAKDERRSFDSLFWPYVAHKYAFG